MKNVKYSRLTEEQKLLARKLRPSDYVNRIYEITESGKIIATKKKKYYFLAIRVNKKENLLIAFDESSIAQKYYNAALPNFKWTRLLSRPQATRYYGKGSVHSSIQEFETTTKYSLLGSLNLQTTP